MTDCYYCKGFKTFLNYISDYLHVARNIRM